MNTVLRDILQTNKVIDDAGNEVALHSSVGEDEVSFISKIIKDHRSTRAIEVGCAMGVSSLAIAEALAANGGKAHTIIDPFQSTQWKNMGVNNLRKAGFQQFQLVEDMSEFALPRLTKEGLRVDFGFIDGWHTFDHTLIDFFYINRMLEVGGVVVIDDVHMQAVSKVARYIYNYPCYEFAGMVKNKELKSARKVFDSGVKVLSGVRHLTGKKVAEELFSPKVLKTDSQLHLDCSMIAFKKIAEDKREWNWYANF